MDYNFDKKNRDRRANRRRAVAANQLRTFKKARDARRAVNGAFGRADKEEYEFMAFGTNAERKTTTND